MKRFLLLISAMLVMSSMMAQDVYVAGYYTGSDNSKRAAVYKNGTKLFDTWLNNFNNYGYSVAVDPATNAVYLVRNADNGDGTYYGDVKKHYNNATSNYIDNTAGTWINKIIWSDYDNNIHAAGYKKGSDGKTYAATWKGEGSTTQFTPNFESGYSSRAYDLVYVKEGSSNTNTWTYYCGYVNQTTSGSPRATIWRGGNVKYTIAGDNSSYAVSIDYYDNAVYTAGYEVINGNNVIKVWKNDTELYTLTSSDANASVYRIKVDGGDVYVTGYGTLRNQYVWKNGVMLDDMGAGGKVPGLAVNSTGFYVGRSNGTTCMVYKNGELLYPDIPNCDGIYDLLVTEKPANTNVRTMPFTENFEMGATDWTSWTVNDVDNNNGTYATYWDRAGKRYITAHGGNHCARHRYHPTNDQEGWLISPKIKISSLYAKLTFWTLEGAPTDYGYEGVWVSTTNTNTSSFTEIWTQTAPSASWKKVTLDLSEYEGQEIYIGFKYSGINAHNWAIDDVSVAEVWSQAGVATVPYTENFTTGLPDSWYNLDNDHKGYYWEWVSSQQCMYHNDAPSSYGAQDGVIFSPRIQLPAGHSYVLKFSEKYNYASYMPTNGSQVYVAVDKSGTPKITDYNLVWYETNPTSSWQTVTVDLSPYAGHTVNIAFRYQGTNAHEWYIDNFDIHSNDGIDDVTSETIAIYPNPAKESIHISGLEKETEVSIYNVTGVMVKKVFTNGEEVINVSDLPAGLYIARFGETTLRFTKE